MSHANNTTNVFFHISSPYETWAVVVLASLAGIVSVVTILGNCLVLLSFFLERNIRQPSNYFIASLAASDLIIGTFSMPLYTVYLLVGYWPLGGSLCDIWLSIDYTVCLASQYTVLFITADRYCSVRIPAKYRNWRTEKKVLLGVAVTWIIPVFLFFVSIIGWQYFVGKRTVPSDKCYAQFVENELFNTLLVICYFWVTLIIMFILYGGIYKIALNLQAKTREKEERLRIAMNKGTEVKQNLNIDLLIETNKNDIILVDDTQPRKQCQNRLLIAPDGVEGGSPNLGRISSSDQTTTTNAACETPKMNKKRMSSIYQEETSDDDYFPTRHNTISTAYSDAKSRTATSGISLTFAVNLRYRIHKLFRRDRKIGETPPCNANTFILIEPPTKVQDESTGAKAIKLDDGLPYAGVYLGPTDDVVGAQDNDIDNNIWKPQTPESLKNKDNTVGQSLEPVKRFQFTSTQVGNIGLYKEYSLCAPSDCIRGLRYIDAESYHSGQFSSRSSIASSENIRVFSDIAFRWPHDQQEQMGVLTEVPEELPESPVWKRRPLANKSNNVKSKIHADIIANSKPSSFITACPIGDPNALQVAVSASTRTCNNVGIPPYRLRNTESVRDCTAPKPQAELANCARSRPRFSLANLKNYIRTRSVGREKKSKRENRARKALRTITIILGAFVLCWTPYHILVLIMGFCIDGSQCINDKLWQISYWFCYLNSPVNPFCYAFANEQFKKTFLRILRRDWHRK